MLDKTGTVTTGRMSLVDVTTADGVDRDEALRLVGALEHASEHPDRPGDRPRGRRDAGPLPPVEGSPTARASASRASSTADA